VAAGISRLLATEPDRWDHVVATKDHHIDPGAHFGDPPDFANSWPRHCVVGTDGAQFHPELAVDRIEAVFHKGEWAAAYSGFEGAAEGGEGLADWLRRHSVQTVELVGIATDHCVRATALDAAREGFATNVLLELTAGVDPGTTGAALTMLREAGVTLHGKPLLGTPQG
jgi:nicotinamidase/pyrazinamidase